MKDQKQLTQEICNQICNAVENDARILAARKKVEKADGKALKAWIGIIIRRISGASPEDTMREMIPLEAELFKLKADYLTLMGSVFEENKASCGLPKDAKFFDCFLHPLDDQELMRTIVDLITFYEQMLPYRKEMKKAAKKTKGAEAGHRGLNGQSLIASCKPQPEGFLPLEGAEKLKMGFAAHFVGIERIKVSIALSAHTCRDIGKRFLRVLKTLPATEITKELAAYFESLECLETPAHSG